MRRVVCGELRVSFSVSSPRKVQASHFLEGGFDHCSLLAVVPLWLLFAEIVSSLKEDYHEPKERAANRARAFRDIGRGSKYRSVVDRRVI